MDITTKLFFDDEEIPSREEAKNYILNALNNSNPDSEFIKTIGPLLQLSRDQLSDRFDFFEKRGYNMMIAYQEGKIIGHIAYQQHFEDGENRWKVFQRYTHPEYRNNGYGKVMAEKLLQHARKKGIKKVRIGTNTHESIVCMNQELAKKQGDLGFKIDLETHWVTLD